MAGAAIALLALLIPASALADPSSLYRGPGPRPGPDILYEPPAVSPQLGNSGIWIAKPILVSGTSAYRSGEFLYQDFLYDDHGANSGQRDQNDPRSNAGTSSDLFSAPNGTYTYPTNPVYAMNAADFVELRVKPLADSTAFRITLNTMKDPSLVGTTIAIGGTPGLNVQYPDGANVSGPAQYFVTVHGTSAKMVNAVGFTPVPVAPTVTVDTTRRQIEVRVPHADWDPTGQVVRLAAGVGLWDNANDKYLIPQQNADATHPGGAGNLSDPPAFFNVAFRWQSGDPATDPGVEPMPKPDETNTTNPAWWRDRSQGNALANHDMSPFFANVDFNKLAAGTSDDMPDQPHGVPQTGPMDRILASHFETEQGIDYSQLCADPDKCIGEYRGQLQPYAIYIPKKPPPPSGYGLTLLLHSLSAGYNQYLSTNNQSQIGERSTGSIVITPEGRGPDGWYYDAAGADTFEVWADVASRYKLDPDYTDISGYSMGGYGTYKFATQYPDLFAKGQPVVGPPGLGIWVPPAPPENGGDKSNTNRMLASLRNIPFLIWNASTDELVPVPGAIAQANTFDSLGLRYIFDLFAPAEHLTLAINDQFQPAADFLGSDRVDRDPAHVTYVVNPTMDFPADGTVADHAYWLSGLKLRDASGDAPLGTIDVRSEGFGVGDPTPNPTQHGGGALTGGNLPALAYSEQSKSWGPTPSAPKADRLDITATNISTVTVSPTRARVSCDAQLNVKSDGPLTVVLAGCGRTARVLHGCDTSRPPRASISRGGLHATRSRFGMSGRAIAFRCAHGHSARGKVKRVNVDVARRAGKRCRFLTRSGRFTSARSCRRPVRLRARLGHARRGKVPWAFSTRTRLPRGRYVVTVHAVDSRGHAQRAAGRFNRRAFRVR